MTTRDRIALIARAFPGEFSRRALEGLQREQLGKIDALDRWISRNGKQVQARAPKTIYHICAGNLAVSALTSIVHGLLLGSQNFVKLPSAREDGQAHREIQAFTRRLPPSLKKLVTLHARLDEGLLASADAVIAFGSDATMDSLRRRTSARQRFIAHGHAVSLLWVPRDATQNGTDLRKCAIDILTYDQMGCLSPQAIYLEKGAEVFSFAEGLAKALEREWRKIDPKPKRGLSAAARVQEARELALSQGHSLWMPPSRHLGWSIIHDPNSLFRPSPLHGLIYLRGVIETGIEAALKSVAGRISTVGSMGAISRRSREAFLKLGVTRFCRAGEMQFPPLTWQHDGRPALSDLVTWSEIES